MSRLLFLHAATNLRLTPTPKGGGGGVVDVHMPCVWRSYVLGPMEVYGH